MVIIGSQNIVYKASKGKVASTSQDFAPEMEWELSCFTRIINQMTEAGADMRVVRRQRGMSSGLTIWLSVAAQLKNFGLGHADIRLAVLVPWSS
jgi:hypothetical protein